MWYKSTAFTKHLFLIRMSPSLLSPSFSCLCLVTPFTLTSLLSSARRNEAQRSSSPRIRSLPRLLLWWSLMCSAAQASPAWTRLPEKCQKHVRMSSYQVYAITLRSEAAHESVTQVLANVDLEQVETAAYSRRWKAPFACVCVLVRCGYYSVWFRLPALVWTPESVQQSDSGHRCN